MEADREVQEGEGGSRSARTVKLVPATAAIVVSLIGCTVLLAGWVADFRAFREIVQGWASMKVNTAVGLILIAAAVFLAWRDKGRVDRRAAKILGLAVTLFGAASLAADVAGIPLPLEDLIQDPNPRAQPFPGRMSPGTALGFVLFGGAIFAYGGPDRRPNRLFITLSRLVAILSGIAITGYAYGVTALYDVRLFVSMAAHTALSFLLLGIGLIALRPWTGFVEFLTRDTLDGRIVRRVLPTAVLAPLVLGWIVLQGVNGDFYRPRFGFVLTALVCSGLLLIVITHTGTILRNVEQARARIQQRLQEHREWLWTTLQSTADAPGALTTRSSRELEREIAARIQAERELQRANQELELRVKERTSELEATMARTESVLNHVLDGIVTIDAQGIIATFNPAAETIFGYDSEEVIGRNVKVLMPEPYHTQHDDYLANYRVSGEPKIIGIGREVEGRRKDGSTFPMDLAVSEFTLNGRHYFTGIIRDISERKQVEDQLREIAAELSEANHRKDRFLATLAHELRNPLAPIRTGLEVLKLAKNAPEQLDDICGTMERQTQQLVALVDDLLDVSRITSGKFRLRKCRVALRDVIQSAAEEAHPFIAESSHELIVNVPEQEIILDADPHRLAQVFSNLLNNAAKYTMDGGRISLTAECLESEAIVTIRDSGFGIPTEKLDEIFEMFSQIDHPLEKSHSGLGIGLTLVKSLVELHDGTIDVHSHGPNQGSEFRVRLPRLKETSSITDKRNQPVVRAIPTTQHRVLIVDDNRSGADMLSAMAKLLGNEVYTAYDGQQAIEMAAAIRPEIVLMDIGMPKMNGYEAARHIREQPWGQAILLVALTGWGQEEDRRRTQQAGFDHHLTKPADPLKLRELLTS